ncbi:MAG: efflux RND transporter periplasmic adaptor subunit [Gammaproteobacteria bacterium]
MEDYSKLRIDPGVKPGAHAPRKRVSAMYLAGGAIIIAILATLMGKAWLDGAVNVKVAMVSRTFPAQAHTLFNATGYVVPQRKADVASKATGRLESLHVEEGSRVKAGQVLARLENRDLLASRNRALANVDVARAQVNEAAAAFDESRLMFERTVKLVTKQFATREDYDAAQARLKKAQAALASARASVAAAESALQETEVAVEYTSIRAPFDGVILRKYADLGDIVAPLASADQSKGAVVSLADMGSLQVEADVAESNFPSVRAGQPCVVQLDALPELRLAALVRSIVPTVDRSKATVLVKIGFLDPDPRILPEMSAKVAFLSRELSAGETLPVLTIPRSAVVRRHQQQVVFRVHGERAEEVVIGSSQALGDRLIVGRELREGDQVVIDPPAPVSDGAKVRVEPL